MSPPRWLICAAYVVWAPPLSRQPSVAPGPHTRRWHVWPGLHPSLRRSGHGPNSLFIVPATTHACCCGRIGHTDIDAGPRVLALVVAAFCREHASRGECDAVENHAHERAVHKHGCQHSAYVQVPGQRACGDGLAALGATGNAGATRGAGHAASPGRACTPSGSSGRR